ncbi:MAG TPA: DsbA family protein [Solirubrobacteraceae bacterium]|nr:DsbA family protein [Solirubrobacteraceae bacterium]
MIEITHFTDPGCPWAYSAWPAHATLCWRYGDALRWTLVTIGLAEDRAQYVARGYSPQASAMNWRTTFAPLGMPFAFTPKADLSATSPACRAIVAARLDAPDREVAAFRALQTAQFTTTGRLEDPAMLREALAAVPGLDADAIVARIDDADVVAAYEAGRARARTATGSPTEFQGRAANTDGAVRYTAPSLIFATDGRSLEAGGFQPIEAYDVVVANLDPTLPRRAPADDPVDVLAAFDYPLASAEVAAVMTPHLGVPDLLVAETALIGAVGDGRAVRTAAGNSSLWALA